MEKKSVIKSGSNRTRSESRTSVTSFEKVAGKRSTSLPSTVLNGTDRIRSITRANMPQLNAQSEQRPTSVYSSRKAAKQTPYSLYQAKANDSYSTQSSARSDTPQPASAYSSRKAAKQTPYSLYQAKANDSYSTQSNARSDTLQLNARSEQHTASANSSRKNAAKQTPYSLYQAKANDSYSTQSSVRSDTLQLNACSEQHTASANRSRKTALKTAPHSLYRSKSDDSNDRVNTNDTQKPQNSISSSTPKFHARTDYKQDSTVKQKKNGAFHYVQRAASGISYTTGFIDPTRQTQIHIERELQPNGKYARTVRFKHSRNYSYSSDGRFHGVLNAVHELSKTKIQGDVPSLSKTLDSVKPKSIGGKVGLKTAKGGYKLTKATVKTAQSTVLAAERGLVAVSGQALNAGKRKLSEEISQTDTGRVLIKANEARKFVRSQLNQRKMYSTQKKRVQLRKEELKLNKKAIDPKLKRAELSFKTEKELFQKHKEELSGTKSVIKKQMLKQRRKKFVSAKKNYSQYRSNAKSIKAAYKKQLKAEKKISRLNGSNNPLIVTKALTSSAASELTNKLRNSDKDNDAIKAVDKSVQAVRKAKAAADSVKLKNAQRKTHNTKTLNQRKNKLKQQENKLHKHDQPPKKKKRRKKKRKDKFKETVKQAVKDTVSAVGVAVSGALKDVLISLTPAVAFGLAIIIVFLFVMSIFAPASQFLLGTYTASDQNLTEAVSVYTGYVNDLHIATYDLWHNKSNWKNALKSANVDCSDYKNKPDDEDFHYGRSQYFNYDPASYDYDPYVLWSFLCAYNYDFLKAEELRKKDKAYSPEYWTVTSEIEDLLKELFDKEYTFEHVYFDSSKFHELPAQFYKKLSKNCEVYWDQFHPTTIQVNVDTLPSEIKAYVKDGELHYNYWTLEVLNARNHNKKTGWYLQDYLPEITNAPYWTSGDVDGVSIAGNEIWYAVPPEDTGIDNIGYIRFIQKEVFSIDAELYYNVRQNCTFEEAAISLLRDTKGSYANAAVEYYNILLGKGDDTPKYHGNHQCMKSPVRATMQELIENDRIFNGFGYDKVEQWNEQHCNNYSGNHSGIDIACSNGEQVLAMVDGEVTYVNDSSVTITATNFELIYSEPEDSSRKYTINVRISNIDPCVTKGQNVSTGDLIGISNRSLKCTYNNSHYWNDYNGYDCYIHCSTEIGRVIKQSIAPEMLIY